MTESHDARPRKLILRNAQSPGDIVMLTAAVRDIQVRYPGRFLIDVRTSCGDLWRHNPRLTRLDENDPEVEVIECKYPLVNRSNQEPWHFLHAFSAFIGEKLGLTINPTAMSGEIHLSDEERAQSTVETLSGSRAPYWVVVAGGKFDLTTKWWSNHRYQAVVDHFLGKIRFVQVGESKHHHPGLERVIDLRGKTSLRGLVEVIHHAQGVLCPITGPMHLAAAVPTKAGYPEKRACVVVAGGREPPHWEAYSHHQFIHTVGALTCCAHGGCWKTRVRSFDDGSQMDEPQRLCEQPMGEYARCMEMITPDQVVDRIETYFVGGNLNYLDA